MESRLPNLFILGAPKCGTTSLAHWLGQHKDIFLPPVKEPHHYNTDENYVLYPDRKKYLRLYLGATSERYLLDASVWYLHSQKAVPNILEDCPNARFIVCLRNPADMAVSLHNQLLTKSYWEHIASFNKAWELSDLRIEGRRVKKKTLREYDPSHLAYKYSCKIGSQSERLLARVSREQVHFVLLEDFITDPKGCHDSIMDFLGLPAEGEPVQEFPRLNPRHSIHSVALHRTVNGIAKAKRVVGLSGVSFGLAKWVAQRNRRSEQQDLMDKETHLKLTEYYRNEIAIISRILGRDLRACPSGALEAGNESK